MSTDPNQHNPYQPNQSSPQPYSFPPSQPSDTDSTGGIIPYKNPHALIAYYLGLFSLFPCVGLLLAIPAFILGIIGLRNRNRNPAIKGSVHAWIGIVMGGLMTIVWGASIVIAIVAAITAK